MSTNPPTYNAKLCVYSHLASLEKIKSMAQMCTEVANGICNGPHHYFNMFKIHYCFFKGSTAAYISLVILISIISFLWLNYVRRSFYARPIFKLREKLGINGNLAEAITVPLAFGIVPLMVSIQGAHKNTDFSFALGTSLGSMLTLSCFVIGVCAVVLKISKPGDSAKITINLLFTVSACILMVILGFKKSVDLIDGVVFLGAYLVYLAFLYLNGEKNSKLFNSIILTNLNRHGQKASSGSRGQQKETYSDETRSQPRKKTSQNQKTKTS